VAHLGVPDAHRGRVVEAMRAARRREPRLSLRRAYATVCHLLEAPLPPLPTRRDPQGLRVPGKRRTGPSRLLLTALGCTQSLERWARATGLGVTALRQRLQRGWSPDEAVRTPPPGHRPRGDVL
jgi:hypothetical protein